MGESEAFGSEFHDSCIFEFRLGPRRALTLTIILDPVWNPGGGSVVVRFGGIDNFDVVSDFFSTIERPSMPDAALARIISMGFDKKSASKQLNRIVLDLEHYGGIEIDCKNVSTH